MASLDTKGLDSVMQDILRRADLAEKAVPRMLKAGGEIVKAAQQAEIRALFKSPRSTGELAASIKASRPRKTSDGMAVEIAPSGVDKKGVRNATKAFVLEYGRKNMTAKPWHSRSAEKAAEPAVEAMLEEWQKAVRDDG